MKRAIFLVLALTASLTYTSLSMTHALAKAPPGRESALSYHDLWRLLWEDHITWTRMVIMGTFDSLPGNDAYKARLLQNYVDMEDALEPYYGDEAEEWGELIEEHLLIAVEILDAAKAGNTPALDDAKARWYENGHELAVQMSEMNPEFWPLEEGDEMWTEHLDATFDEAVAHLTNDFAGDVTAYDRVVELAMEMADFMSAGIIHQFRSSFSGTQCLRQHSDGDDDDGDDDDEDDDDEEDDEEDYDNASVVQGLRVRPGPSGASREFQFAMVKNNPVSLILFDLSGRRVTTVFQGELSAGSHSLVWNGQLEDGSRPAAGVYFARLTAGSETRTVKLIETKP